MRLLTRATVLCLLGLVYFHSCAPAANPPEPEIHHRSRRFLEAREIEKFGNVTAKATELIEKLVTTFNQINDPEKARELREGPLGDRIRAAVRTGKAFVELIESISAAMEELKEEE
ncbi:uncharacterized protein [Penaeus vannamei]|uniref:uncharacterized protein n=1 Tax=Penaeus vannamei TaxID=6689 RepID=UPI00387F903A